MKFKRSWGDNGKEYSLSYVIDHDLTSDSHNGIAESANRNAMNVIEKFGMLVELLHNKKLITDDEAMTFINKYAWEKIE